MRRALLAAALLAVAGALHAQPADKAAKSKAAAGGSYADAVKACDRIKRSAEKDPMKADPARTETAFRECVQREMCAKAKDRKACNQRFAKAYAREDKARKSCAASKGKGAKAYTDCMDRELCADAKDPARCETRLRAARVCEPLKSRSDAYRECVQREHCKLSDDPARCEARAKDLAARRDACRGKQGDELRACMKEQRAKKK